MCSVLHSESACKANKLRTNCKHEFLANRGTGFAETSRPSRSFRRELGYGNNPQLRIAATSRRAGFCRSIGEPCHSGHLPVKSRTPSRVWKSRRHGGCIERGRPIEATSRSSRPLSANPAQRSSASSVGCGGAGRDSECLSHKYYVANRSQDFPCRRLWAGVSSGQPSERRDCNNLGRN